MTSLVWPTIKLIAQNYHVIDLGYNIIQAGITHRANQNPGFFAKIEKIKNIFMAVDFISGSVTALVLIEKMERRFHGDAEIIIALGMVAFTISSIAIVRLFNKLFKPKDEIITNEEIKNNIISKLNWERPFSDKEKQFSYVVRSVINIALFCISAYNPIFAISAAVEIYSLAKLTQRKWIHLHAKKEEEIGSVGRQVMADKIKCDYYFLLQQTKKHSANEDGECSICLDNSPDVYFCENHIYHRDCILQHIDTKMKTIFNSIDWKTRSVQEIRHYSGSNYTHSTYRAIWKADMSKTTIPSCPNCRGIPEQNKLKVLVKDRFYGWSPLKITLTEA